MGLFIKDATKQTNIGDNKLNYSTGIYDKSEKSTPGLATLRVLTPTIHYVLHIWFFFGNRSLGLSSTKLFTNRNTTGGKYDSGDGSGASGSFSKKRGSNVGLALLVTDDNGSGLRRITSCLALTTVAENEPQTEAATKS